MPNDNKKLSVNKTNNQNNKMIKLSNNNNRTIIVHSRSSGRDMFANNNINVTPRPKSVMAGSTGGMIQTNKSNMSNREPNRTIYTPNHTAQRYNFDKKNDISQMWSKSRHINNSNY